MVMLWIYNTQVGGLRVTYINGHDNYVYHGHDIHIMSSGMYNMASHITAAWPTHATEHAQ